MSTTYELGRLGVALGLSVGQTDNLAARLGDAVTLDASHRKIAPAAAVETLLGAGTDVSRKALAGLYASARTPAPAPAGPTDAQRAAAAQACHNVRTIRAGATFDVPADRRADVAEARANARRRIGR